MKNWRKFQHYHDRRPPWIKLDAEVFQDPDFSSLSDASKLLAICSWTLASRSEDGSIPDDFSYISRWGFLSSFIKESNLKELITKGFLIRASNTLATVEQSAIPETERDKRENRKETDKKAELPDWMPLESWQAFSDMRKQIHKPITTRAQILLCEKLSEFRSHGYDVAVILDTSTMNCWQGVFEPRPGGSNGTGKVIGDAQVGKWDGRIPDSKGCMCYHKKNGQLVICPKCSEEVAL